jgi:hypothetical protein
MHEWARDEDGDGHREVHCNTCEGAGAALRTYLRAFRGVHKQYLHLYVATYEALVNARHVTPKLIRRMYVPALSAHYSYSGAAILTCIHQASTMYQWEMKQLLTLRFQTSREGFVIGEQPMSSKGSKKKAYRKPRRV